MPKGEVQRNIHDQFDVSDEKKFVTNNDDEGVFEGIAPEDRLFDGEDIFEKNSKSKPTAPTSEKAYRQQSADMMKKKQEKNSHEPKVMVDPGYFASPEKSKNKVVIDLEYSEAIREESPEDYMPELSSDLLEEVFENDSTDEEMAYAHKFGDTVEALSATFAAKNSELQLQKQAILETSGGDATALSRKDREKIWEISQQEQRLQKHHDSKIEEAEQAFKDKMFELAEPVGVDMGRYAEAARRYDLARQSIEDDYQGDVEDARKAFSEKYAEKMKKTTVDSTLQAELRALKHQIDVALPRVREERLKDAEKTFTDAITPTPFERDLNDLTVSFEKRVTKIENIKARLLAEKARASKSAETNRWYDEQLKALSHEAELVAKNYVIEADQLKKEKEQADKKAASSVENSKRRETMPVREAAFLHVEEIESLISKFGPETEREVLEMEADVASPEEIALEQEVLRAKKKLEKKVLEGSEQELLAEKKNIAIRWFDQEAARIDTYYKQAEAAIFREHQELFGRYTREKSTSSKEKNNEAKQQELEGMKKRLQDLHLASRVELPAKRWQEMTRAEEVYRREIVVTGLDRELFSLTVSFENKSARLIEKKIILHDMMRRENDPAGRARLQHELDNLNGQLRDVAEKYSKDVDMTKEIHRKESLLVTDMELIAKMEKERKQSKQKQQSNRKQGEQGGQLGIAA